jgi:hypothetical protein
MYIYIYICLELAPLMLQATASACTRGGILVFPCCMAKHVSQPEGKLVPLRRGPGASLSYAQPGLVKAEIN